MAIELSTAEVASLKGCSTQYIRRLAKTEELKGHKCLNADGSPGWMFLVEELPAKLQEKYYNQLRASLPEASLPEGAKPKVAKPLDTYSAEEQEEIAFWLRLVKQWQGYRNKPGANKTEVDANFVQWCKLEYPERAISVDTLYRRWNAVRDNDLDGLIDKRGKWKKGKSSIPDPMWQAFLYFYLDERQHPLKKCYEYTKLEMQMSFPELVGDMPSYTTFYRRAQADIPEPLKVLGREGEKAFRDRCAPYIRRVYDDMRSNEWWIADNHTFDIITEGENGQRHRLYLTAFFDARSGIFTGCYVTNAPSSQSTLIALRRGILKYGIPENIYVDNGREFLTYDVGGLGHRKKKPKDGQERFEPPPVFERLGIHMTNAIVRNAKAKIIERRFRDVKDHLSRLFDTFTGGNVLEKPESLKFILKDGRIPLDSTLVETVEELLDWYFNQQPYWSAGDTKAITINGTVGNFTFSNLSINAFILGFNHNSGKEGTHRIHWQLGKISGTMVGLCDNQYGNNVNGAGYFHMNDSNTNVGGWKDSSMRKTLLGNSNTPTSPLANSLMAALPSDLRAVMKSVTKYTDNVGNATGNVAGNVTVTTDYLFLLAEFEVFGARYYANDYERNSQLQYDYYKAGNSKIAYKHTAVGTAVWWWLRSPDYSDHYNFCRVNTGGGDNISNAYYSAALLPGFAT